MVSSGSGILPEYQGVIGTPLGSIGPPLALVEREEGRKGWLRPPWQSKLDYGREWHPLSLSLSFLFPSSKKEKGGILLGVES